jgi:hypothetical protein
MQHIALRREVVVTPSLLQMNQGKLARAIGVVLQGGDGEKRIHNGEMEVRLLDQSPQKLNDFNNVLEALDRLPVELDRVV